MSIVDAHVLNYLLFKVERNIGELGWDQPDVLFAITDFPEDPHLVYVAQLPGPASGLLRQMLTAGMQAREEIDGLILAASAGRQRRIAVAVLRDGNTAVIDHEGPGRPLFVERIPEEVEDHDEVTAMVTQLLMGDRGSPVASRDLTASGADSLKVLYDAVLDQRCQAQHR